MKPRRPYRRRKAVKRLPRWVRESIAARMEWSTRVRERDGRCQYCRSVDLLEAHHVYPKSRYPDLRYLLDNGLTLCQPCHHRWHAASRLWKQWWQEKWVDRAATIESMLHAKIVVARPAGNA